MIEVYKAIARIAESDATVLVTGESGTGKELLARALHEHSARRSRRFVAVNCGALTDALLSSELFGHVRGAFTGAERDHRGLFENAAGGTIFLDEITETSPAFQVKLLRVLQEKTIRPVGATDERAVDVRVVAATNRRLESLFASDGFRQDLLYRLSVLNVHLPALRERREDVTLLARSFLKRFSKRLKKPAAFEADALAYLMAHDWPGNVRELEHAVERAVTMTSDGHIRADDLRRAGSAAPAAAGPVPAAMTEPMREPADEAAVSFVATLEDGTRRQILDALRHTGGNKTKAARILGIGRWSLYRMAERLGIDLDAPFETGVAVVEEGEREGARGRLEALERFRSGVASLLAEAGSGHVSVRDLEKLLDETG
jgi:two-component system response regulator HydG